MNLTADEKKILLNTARKSITSLFITREEELTEIPTGSVFNSRCGAFVTLTIDNRLRGCIGYITTEKPLLQTIKEAALQAATSDPRFSPLREDELPLIKIELSILSESFPINNYDEIILGTHGLILEEGGRRGLLLPQVPIEHKMNREQFLNAICQKTGLYELYWKEKQLNLRAFTATVFSEENLEN